MICNIIIPCYNLVEHTRKCIQSIKKYTQFPYRIIAIDDASSDDTYKYLKKEGIETIRHKENKGWWRSLNEGLKYSKADYYAILDRDCIVTSNWLTKLIECFKLPKIGIISPTSNAGPEAYGTQCLHNYGGELIYKYFRKRNPYNPRRIYWLLSDKEIQEFASMVEKEYSRQYSYQSPFFFFSVVLSQKTIDKVGYLNERYKTWHGDLEYGIKARDLGLEGLVRKDTYVHHYKFPPLTQREIRKAPYLKKYKFLRTDTEIGLGQFISKEQLRDTNRDWITWLNSPYADSKVSCKEGGVLK